MFNAKTGRSRRPWFVVAAGIAVALIVGSGVAVASASSAEAHTPAVNWDCTGVKVDAWWYNTSAGVNTVTVEIEGQQTQTRTFDVEFHETFAFPDPTEATSFRVFIDAPDGKDGKEWDYEIKDKSKACATPDISIKASACDATTGKSTVKATFGDLDTTHEYTVELASNGGSTADAVSINPTTGTYEWTGLDPGYDYTATLKDLTVGLESSDTAHSVGCASDPDFKVTIDQCVEPEDDGKYTAEISGLVDGRSYTVAFVSDGGSTLEQSTFTADDDTYTAVFDAPPSGSYYVTITDDELGSTSTKKSSTEKFLPCPAVLEGPELTVTDCTVTDGSTDATLAITVDGLVPGRSYTVVVNDGTTDTFTKDLPFVGASTWSETLTNVAPGSYSVTVTDVTDKDSTSFTSTSHADVVACPAQQTVAVEATKCTVPGGSSDLTATVTDFEVGRTYTIALTRAGLPVDGQPVTQEFTPTDDSAQVFTWTKLEAGYNYRIIVTDKAQPAIIAAGDIAIKSCPGNPTVILTQGECSIVGKPSIKVDLSKLVDGESYTVSIVTSGDKKTIKGVPAVDVTATGATSTVIFDDVPNNSTYTVTVSNGTKTLTATGEISLKNCEHELAYTGTSTLTPTLAGIGFLQLGVVLVGISLVRRRSGARKA